MRINWLDKIAAIEIKIHIKWASANQCKVYVRRGKQFGWIYFWSFEYQHDVRFSPDSYTIDFDKVEKSRNLVSVSIKSFNSCLLLKIDWFAVWIHTSQIKCTHAHTQHGKLDEKQIKQAIASKINTTLRNGWV